MRTSLGISTGASGVGSVLVVDASNGRTTEYRELATDTHDNHDVGALVFDAVTLMTTQVSDLPKPEVVTVTYRTTAQADAIRTAAIREGRLVRLIPETTALLTYLHSTGLTGTDGTIAIADIGASGMSVSVLDHADGTVLHADRTDAVGGETIIARLLDHVRRSTGGVRTRMPVDADLLAARCLGALETLTVADTARIEISEAAGVSVTVTRAEFDELIADLVGRAAEFTARTCADAPATPQVLALVGGVSAVPSLSSAVAAAFGGTTLTVDDPATVAAHGAAYLDEQPHLDRYPLVGTTGPGESRSSARTAGALVGALVAGALVAGYATDQIREPGPTDRPVSPAGSSESVLTATPDTVESDATAPTETRIPSFDPLPTRVPTGGAVATTTTPDEAPGTRVTTTPPTTVPETTSSLLPPKWPQNTQRPDRDHDNRPDPTTGPTTPEPSAPPTTTIPPTTTPQTPEPTTPGSSTSVPVAPEPVAPEPAAPETQRPPEQIAPRPTESSTGTATRTPATTESTEAPTGN